MGKQLDVLCWFSKLNEWILAYVGCFGHLLNTYPVTRAIALPLVIGLCETGGSRPPCNPARFPLEDPRMTISLHFINKMNAPSVKAVTPNARGLYGAPDLF